MIERLIESPIPSPCALVLKNGAKTSTEGSGRPIPLSRTETSTASRPVAVVVMATHPSPLECPFLERVAHQVEDDLLDLHAVAQDRGQLGREVELDLDATK